MTSLANMSTHVFDDSTMKAALPPAVYDRFKDCVRSGSPTPEEDQQVIADAVFNWSKDLGAVGFAHWFFPMRGGGGATGGALGALKQDTFVDLDWSSSEGNRPFGATFPAERIFVGETDGSSFPNGGLRATHTAAAFTTWDRTSPMFVYDKILRIPCAFVTQKGDSIDEKTILLRSADAVNREGMRLLKNISLDGEATCIHSYLGWEQEFFVVSADLYQARPDLVNCGRTLLGAPSTRNQQGDLNYFAPVPSSVETLLDNIRAEMLKMGCAMCVAHNEVAPGQHEMSPIFCVANASADYNVLFMEVAQREATKLGLAVLFHEKPFAGINGSGKHCNWSIGTDTGKNFFYPGKSDSDRELFVTGVACLATGLAEHNELIRCAVAAAGNDHRLGAQEAPPAIMSLYPGPGFEKHVDAIIAGAPLLGYKAEKQLADLRTRSAMPVPTNVEDRNRTAPFPFCGNRFEFRAVGSSQNCAFPVAMCNTIMAAGMSELSGLIEGGMSHRDAVAQMLARARPVIFTGNGYAQEWQVEAAKRGLPNLRTTVDAARAFNSAKNKAVFSALDVLSEDEADARVEVMLEAYNTALAIEANTLLNMVNTGILPACAKDLASYAAAPSLAGDRASCYESIKAETDKLAKQLESMPSGLAEEAQYLSDVIKPQMLVIRALADKAEGLMEKGLYPYPTYEELVYSHH